MTLRDLMAQNQRAFFDGLRALCEKHKATIGGPIGESSPWVLFASSEVEFGELNANADLVTVRGEIVSARTRTGKNREGYHRDYWIRRRQQMTSDEIEKLVDEIEQKAGSDGIWRDIETRTWWRIGEHGFPVTVTKPDDPARVLFFVSVPSTTDAPTKKDCYICNDSEFSRMGLPLCRKCPVCGGHVAADDTVCDECGVDDHAFYQAESEDALKHIFCALGDDSDRWAERVPTPDELERAISKWRAKNG